MDRFLGTITCFFFQGEDGIRDVAVTGVQTCALPISFWTRAARASTGERDLRIIERHRGEHDGRRWSADFPARPGGRRAGDGSRVADWLRADAASFLEITAGPYRDRKSVV